MKHNLLIASIITLFFVAPTYALKLNQYNSVEGALHLGLPVVEIYTENEEEPSCEYVNAPAGSWGQGITNATKVPGSINVYSPEGELIYSSGEYEKGESGMTIKIRGNTSAYYDKKPFKIKLQKKGDMMGRGDKNYNDKNWNLLSDPHMLLYLSFQLSRIMGKEWTPEARYVNVIINGDFRGMYLLTEAVERNVNCRINVDETGFIAEHDPYWWNEEGQFLLSLDNPQYNYTFKYPDFEDISSSQKITIGNSLYAYEQSIRSGNYNDFIDTESFALWILVHDILGTFDGAGVNFFLTKYDDTDISLIKTGPIWDCDSSYGTPDNWSSVHSSSRFSYLFESENKDFLKAYIFLWDKLGIKAFTEMSEFLDSLSNVEEWFTFDQSSWADMVRWDKENSLIWEIQRDGRDWYESRYEWMNKEVDSYRATVDSGIEDINDYGHSSFKIVQNKLIPLSSDLKINLYNTQGQTVGKYISKEGEEINLPSEGVILIQVNDKTIKHLCN